MSHTYAVVIEPTGTGFSAYVPDLPGCVAAGSTREAVLGEIRAAIQLHLDGLARDGLVKLRDSKGIGTASVTPEGRWLLRSIAAVLDPLQRQQARGSRLI